MKYLILIYSDETRESQLSEDEWQNLLEQHNGFFTRHSDRIIAGDALEPTKTAKTLRRVNGTVTTLDGPFAETKEQLGGYYLIEADSLDSVVAMAKELPLADHSSIEVRPVMVME